MTPEGRQSTVESRKGRWFLVIGEADVAEYVERRGNWVPTTELVEDAGEVLG
jgi:hypothetical protein